MIFQLVAPFSKMHPLYTVSAYRCQLVVEFDGGDILPSKEVILQTSFGAKFLMLLPYHIILSPEI